MSCFFFAWDIHVDDGGPLEPNAQLCCDTYRKDFNEESHVLCRNRHEPYSLPGE